MEQMQLLDGFLENCGNSIFPINIESKEPAIGKQEVRHPIPVCEDFKEDEWKDMVITELNSKKSVLKQKFGMKRFCLC